MSSRGVFQLRAGQRYLALDEYGFLCVAHSSSDPNKATRFIEKSDGVGTTIAIEAGRWKGYILAREPTQLRVAAFWPSFAGGRYWSYDSEKSRLRCGDNGNILTHGSVKLASTSRDDYLYSQRYLFATARHSPRVESGVSWVNANISREFAPQDSGNKPAALSFWPATARSGDEDDNSPLPCSDSEGDPTSSEEEDEPTRPDLERQISVPSNLTDSDYEGDPTSEEESDEEDSSFHPLAGTTHRVSQRLTPLNKRQMVVREFINTEQAYSRSLQVLLNGFAPRLGQVSTNGDRILSVDEYKCLFDGLASIKDLSIKIYKELLDAGLNGDVGNTFTMFAPYMRMYKEFLDKRSKIQATLDTVSNDPTRGPMLGEVCAHFAPEGTLDSLLTRPAQRLPRYCLLLKELIKHIDAELSVGRQDASTLGSSMSVEKLQAHKDNARHALQLVKSVAIDLDESIETKHQEDIALDILRKWSWMLPPDNAASRRLIFEGVVEKHAWDSLEARVAGKPPDRTTKKHLLLFSDCLAHYSLSGPKVFLHSLGRTPVITHVLCLPVETKEGSAAGETPKWFSVWSETSSDHCYTEDWGGTKSVQSLRGGDAASPWCFSTPDASEWCSEINAASERVKLRLANKRAREEARKTLVGEASSSSTGQLSSADVTPSQATSDEVKSGLPSPSEARGMLEYIKSSFKRAFWSSEPNEPSEPNDQALDNLIATMAKVGPPSNIKEILVAELKGNTGKGGSESNEQE